jgi:hypothetical protein
VLRSTTVVVAVVGKIFTIDFVYEKLLSEVYLFPVTFIDGLFGLLMPSPR